MIAYNNTGMDNGLMQEQASEALEKNCISQEEYARIKEKYPVGFYTPNIYIRIGLFLLTVIIVIFSLGLLALLVNPNFNGIATLLIFLGFVCYGVLEYLVYGKKHFRSGVDDALQWLTVGLLLAGFNFEVYSVSALSQCLIVFILTLWCCLRFADRVAALVAYAALLGILFNGMTTLGSTGNTLLPFLVMAVSVAIYFLGIALGAKERFRHYHACTTLLQAASLVSFYLAGNYFVVREMRISLLSLPPVATLTLGWIFWILTVGTPLFYIFRGVRNKDVIFFWIGLGLIAAAVFTIRHYYSILPLEWALVIAGILQITVAYALTKYLRTPRNGFTSEATDDRHFIASLHIESLVIAESFAPTTPSPTNDFQFGGGSGGGGGAGGQY